MAFRSLGSPTIRSNIPYVTPVTTKRIVPAKVKGKTAKQAILARATQVAKPKVSINFVKSVRG